MILELCIYFKYNRFTIIGKDSYMMQKVSAIALDDKDLYPIFIT